MSEPAGKRATFEDLVRLGEQVHAEVIGGEIVVHLSPLPEHGSSLMSLGYDLIGPYGRGRGGPGGWWLMSDVDLELQRHEVYRPDLLGYRKDRVPDFPRERPLRLRPDWVCEVPSPSNARYDLGHKRGVYHRAGVPWYWIVDPVHRTIVACAWHEKGYLIAEGQEGEGNLRLPPFPEAELDLDAIFPPPAG